MKSSRLLAALCLFAALAMCTADARAQMGGGMGMGRGSRGMHSSEAGGEAANCAAAKAPPDPNTSTQVSFRLLQLGEALKLQPAQAGPWQSFSGRVRALAGEISVERGLSMDLRPGADSSAALGMKHIDQALKVAHERLSAIEDVQVAAQALYKVLTSEQQAIADSGIPSVVVPRPIAPVGASAAN
jgi:hypothetical protein